VLKNDLLLLLLFGLDQALLHLCEVVIVGVVHKYAVGALLQYLVPHLFVAVRDLEQVNRRQQPTTA
jgi:hypothetical protein